MKESIGWDSLNYLIIFNCFDNQNEHVLELAAEESAAA